MNEHSRVSLSHCLTDRTKSPYRCLIYYTCSSMCFELVGHTVQHSVELTAHIIQSPDLFKKGSKTTKRSGSESFSIAWLSGSEPLDIVPGYNQEIVRNCCELIWETVQNSSELIQETLQNYLIELATKYKNWIRMALN